MAQDNHVFSLSKDVEQTATPSPLTSPSTPRGVHSFGPLTINTDCMMTSPTLSEVSIRMPQIPKTMEEIKLKMNQDLAANGSLNNNKNQKDHKIDICLDEENGNSTKTTPPCDVKHLAGNGTESSSAKLNTKNFGSARSKRPDLKLQMPISPDTCKTPTQVDSNEFPMARKKCHQHCDCVGVNDGHHGLPVVRNGICDGGEDSKGNHRPPYITQESVQSPSAPLMNKHQTRDHTHSSNQMPCVMCGTQVTESKPFFLYPQAPLCAMNCHQQQSYCSSNQRMQAMPTNCSRTSCHCTSQAAVDNSVMSKNQSQVKLTDNDYTQDCNCVYSTAAEKPKKRASRVVLVCKWILLLLFFIAVSGATSYVVLQQLLRRQQDNSVIVSSDFNSTVCVKCESLRLTSSPQDDYSTSLRQSGDMCCADDSDQLLQIMEAIATKQVRVNEVQNPLQYSSLRSSLGNSTKNMYSAHVYLDRTAKGSDITTSTRKPLKDESGGDYYEDQPYIGDEYQQVQGWTKSPITAFIRGGIKLREDKTRLQVMKDGIYFVYSHLSVKPPAGGADQGLIFSHRIEKENIQLKALGPKPVMEETQLADCPDIKTNHPCHSSSLGSLLKLRNGDELFVSVTHPDLVVRDQLSSYFGLYRIDG